MVIPCHDIWAPNTIEMMNCWKKLTSTLIACAMMTLYISAQDDTREKANKLNKQVALHNVASYFHACEGF